MNLTDSISQRGIYATIDIPTLTEFMNGLISSGRRSVPRVGRSTAQPL
jgi:hypothetical protein